MSATETHHDRIGVGASAALIGLASVTVVLSVGASNPGMWDFTPYLLVPSLLAFLPGLLTVVLIKRLGGNVEAGTIAALVAVLLLVGAGTLVRPLGAWGVVAVVGIALATFWLARRLLRAFNLRWLFWWVAITLVLVNGASVVRILAAEISANPEPDSGEAPAWVEGDRPDVAVLILDELASPITTPVEPADEAKLNSLENQGYQVREALWSSYTVSAASIPAILDGSHPLTGEGVFDEATTRRLGAISRGDNRLVETLKPAGYEVTMVESGLWMTSCGPAVDVCVEGHPLNEMLGVLLEKSAFRWWYERFQGDAFIVSALHAMDGTRQALMNSAGNGQPDLIVSHIMLPHFPYLLDRSCQPHGEGRHPYRTREVALSGYQRQAGCVISWLVETLGEVDRASVVPPAVVVVGDHGTNLAGQLYQPPTAWTREDVVERLAVFGAFRLPAECPPSTPDSTPEIVDALLACMSKEDPTLDDRHFLIWYGPDDEEVVEYPAESLEEGLKSRE